MASKKGNSNGKSKRGGRRPNAGRKSSLVKKIRDDINASANALIGAHLDKLIANCLVLANGVTVAEERDDGTSLVFTRAPDLRANIYLLDRVLGKPREGVEVSGPDGSPVQVEIMLSAAMKGYGGPQDGDQA